MERAWRSQAQSGDLLSIVIALLGPHSHSHGTHRETEKEKERDHTHSDSSTSTHYMKSLQFVPPSPLSPIWLSSRS